MDNKKNIGIILTIILIVAGFLGLLGYKSIPAFFKDIPVPHSDPFEVQLSPQEIYQGQYTYQNPKDFKLTITPDKTINITSIKIKEDNFQIIREITGERLNIKWEYNYGGDIFDSSRSLYYNLINKEFEIYGCDNCFFGDNRDYTLRMIIDYSVDGVQQSPEIIEKKIDVI